MITSLSRSSIFKLKKSKKLVSTYLFSQFFRAVSRACRIRTNLMINRSQVRSKPEVRTKPANFRAPRKVNSISPQKSVSCIFHRKIELSIQSFFLLDFSYLSKIVQNTRKTFLGFILSFYLSLIFERHNLLISFIINVGNLDFQLISREKIFIISDFGK